MTSSQNILELLGLAANEVVNTRLLRHAIATIPQFQAGFLRLLRGSSDDCAVDCRVHHEVTVDTRNGRRRVDLVVAVLGQGGLDLYVIENKITAGEGFEQTADYASSEAENSLRAFLAKQEPGLASHVAAARFHYRYLVLFRDDTPTSLAFVPMQHVEVAKVIRDGLGIDGHSILAQVLASWASLVEQFDRSCQAVDLALPLGRLLAEASAPLDPAYARFCRVAASIRDELVRGGAEGLCLSAYRESKSGRTWYGAKFWFPGWDTDSVLGQTIGRSVHFQFSVNALDLSVALALHYETNPYLPQNEARKDFEGDFKRYLSAREAFANRVGPKLTALGWRRVGRWNMVAKRNLVDSLVSGPTEALLSEVASCLRQAISAVVAELNSEP